MDMTPNNLLIELENLSNSKTWTYLMDSVLLPAQTKHQRQMFQRAFAGNEEVMQSAGILYGLEQYGIKLIENKIDELRMVLKEDLEDKLIQENKEKESIKHSY